ncbi:putative C6 transcription factor [Aspergillus cavernicola]|uniref:C6 transcription factor n=1 Tax=Aspergillus cavernicola TaxID=176166 RepID=A0ABR4I856_9EURO
MESSNVALSSGGRRKRPRPTYSCVECTRRKLRCSKDIPCSACVERGIAQLCRRRPGSGLMAASRSPPATRTRRNADWREAFAGTPASEILPTDVSHPSIPGQDTVSEELLSLAPPSTPARCHTTHPTTQLAGGPRPRQMVVDNVTDDAGVVLEFLALSRQRVLQIAQVEQFQLPGGNGNAAEASDPLFTPSQVRTMMIYHQESIAWIHNVVHLPTFREQCEHLFANPTDSQGLWVGLYYAMLAVTLYHMDPSLLQDLDIHSPSSLAELCYQKSINSLHDADFMNNHNLFSIQAICLLIYIGHNIGQSDRISVLLACGVRIAQCLCLHRLGSDSGTNINQAEECQQAMQRRLVDREVSKRVWWFLVRQDWLQIPYNNTYTIHPTQFNTPMPMNCDEEVPIMFHSRSIIDHDHEHYTQGSYTMVLNHVTVLIWRTQDRMCQQGHPDGVEDGLRKLYSEVIKADRELRQLMDKMPSFFRTAPEAPTMLPAHVRYQREVLSLALAHKFYSIHRHFQIPSFKDPWFAYTKVSCLPIMRRSLATILSLPDDPYSSIVRNMWTLNTHVLTAAVWLIFELIFTRDNNQQLFDDREIRDLAIKSSRFLEHNQSRSRIAKRGVSLINTLLEMDRSIERGDEKQFSLKDIIFHVESSDHDPNEESGALPSPQLNGGSIVDWLSRDAATWEDIMDVLDSAE